MNHNNKFLRKEYMKNLFPIMFSVLGGTINALIDSAFVSQKLGNNGLAAVNMCMPVYLVLCSIGCLIAGGASVMSAQESGKQRMKEAENYYQTALFLLLMIGTAITIIGIPFCRPLANLLAQNGNLTDYVYQYCLITLIGTIPTILLYIPTYYLQLEGKMRAISIMMALIILADIALDYTLMFVFDFGITGASLASVLSTTIACAYGFIMLRTGYSNYHLRLVKIHLKQLKNIFYTGSPAALGNFVDAIKFLFLNAIILYYGGTGAVAVWAVLNSLSEFALSITSGVPQAAAPMIGTYYTARENSGLRILMKLQTQTGLFLSACYMIVLIVLHRVFEHIFVIEENLVIPLICLGLFCLFDVVCSIWITFFQSTRKIIVSDFLTFCRKFLFPVGVAAILMASHGYIFLFLPIGSILTLLTGLLLTGIAFVRNQKGSRPLSRFLLLDDYLEREKKVLDFSIFPDTENICKASEQIKEFCETNQMETRLTIRLGLAIEELMTVLAQKNKNLTSVDLRVFTLDGTTGIRIRCAGIQYNPFEEENEPDDDFLMGVNMIQKLAEVVTYTYSLGMNTINILFEKNSQNDTVNQEELTW